MKEDGQKTRPTGLPLHRANPRILEEEPIVHLVVLTGVRGVADLVLGIIAWTVSAGDFGAAGMYGGGAVR